MKQDIANQYDDDLTLGSDEYDDSYYTDADDLFDFSTNDESPISRLKSLVLSIDWEITDEVLLQFNEELIDLKGIWAGNSINLVYVQALEKISKYIYQNKANSHPNSIKLLLTLYYNLEKIVSSEELSETQKKEILLEDVKRFEALKRQISQKSKPAQGPPPAPKQAAEVKKEVAPEDKLLNLKAIVLGIDWEITDQDLNDLRREVIRLEEQFADSKPKLILLQGIGTLGAYIKNKKSNAHADAFKVLHLFYESLEKIVESRMSLEEEKAILFPAVHKFNEFKVLIGPTISPEAIGREEDKEEEEEEFEEITSGEISPALADVTDEEIGFQADEEAKSLGIDPTQGVSSQIDSFFGEAPPAVENELSATDADDLLAKEKTFSAGFDNAAVISSVEREAALQGVDVGADDEEEDADDSTPAVAALADVDEDAVSEWKESDSAAEEVVLAIDEEQPESSASQEEIAKAADSLFPDTEFLSLEVERGGVAREVALQGVNVETEADEDSDEILLPMEGEEIAPALLSSEEESLFSAVTLDNSVASGGLSEEIVGTLDDLFLEEEYPAFAAPKTSVNDDLIGEKSLEEAQQEEIESLVVEQPAMEESVGEVGTRHPEIPELDRQSESQEAAGAKEDEAAIIIHEEEDAGLFFSGVDLEQSAEESAAVDSLFESLEPAFIEEDEEEHVAAEIDKQTEPLLLQDGEHASDEEFPVTAVDEVTSGEETFFIDEDASPVETEEMTLIGNEVPSVEDDIALFEEEHPVAEDLFSIKEEITAAEEDVALVAEPAVEEMLSFKDMELPGEEEISFLEETSPVEEEVTPGEDAFSFAEEDSASIEDEASLAEDFSPFEENISSTVGMSPVVGESAIEIGEAPEKALSVEEFAVPLHPAEEASFIAAMTSPAEEIILEEEEVVFQLADESEGTEAVPEAPVAPLPEEPALASADEVEVGLPPAFLETVPDEGALSFATAELTSDPLAGLGTCIESLGIELHDKIINGLFQEINSLRQKWSDRPLEKTFLQLLSSITQHIDNYRFEASAEAHSLLISVYNALSARRDDDTHYNQELLLVETLKVLEWQQGMLTRQTMQKGSQLLFPTPVRLEGEEAEGIVDARQDFDQLLQEYDLSEQAGLAVDEPPLEATTEHGAGSLNRETLAVELKQEIASLRMTLQKEIAALRNELTGK